MTPTDEESASEPDDALVGLARRLSDELLFPAAEAVEASDLVPAQQLDTLAAAGLYGILGPRQAGGLDANAATYVAVLEELARGCLTTTFVYSQHHNAVRTVAAAADEVRRRWLQPLCTGSLRAGVAFSGLRRPDPPPLVVTRHGDELVFEGSAPWVTGWGRIDVVHVAARSGGQVVWALVDAVASASLAVEPLRLGAVQASGTVSLAFSSHRVPSERVTLVEDLEDWRRRDRLGLRPNGSHALGLARRCAALAGASSLEGDIDACRQRLDRASPDELPQARAEAALLAHRAAAYLVASGGGRSMVVGNPAERLQREASFLLVFGQSPTIRSAMLDRLGA